LSNMLFSVLVGLPLVLGALTFTRAIAPVYRDLTGTSLGHTFLKHDLGDYSKDAIGHERYTTISDFKGICEDSTKLQTVKDILKAHSDQTPMMGMVNGHTVVYLDKFNRLIIEDTKSEDVRKAIFNDESEYDYTFAVKTSQFHTYGTVSKKDSNNEYNFGIAPKSSNSFIFSDYSHLREEDRHKIMYHQGHKHYNVLKDGYGLFDYSSMEVAFDLNHAQLEKMNEFLNNYHQRANKHNLEGYNLLNNNCASFMSKVFQHVYGTDIKPSEFYKSEEMDLRDKGVYQQFVSSRPAYISLYNASAVADLASDFVTGKGVDELSYRWSGFFKHHTDKVTKLFYGEEDTLNELFYRSASDDVTKVTEILEKNPDLINASDDYGYTPLHYALEYSCPNVAKYLIENGADLNAKDVRGFEALQKIFTKDFIDNFWKIEPSLTQNYEGSYNTFDTKRYISPLFSSALANKPDIIAWLVERGADINQINTEHFNIAHAAGKAHNVETFEFLKDNFEHLFNTIDARYHATPEQLFNEYEKFATERGTLKEEIDLIQALNTNHDQLETPYFAGIDQHQADEIFQHLELPEAAVAA
jgi:hypothetical protein